jgi:putative proteasome-type protease
MTYCVGILLDTGMVFASDSRTNAGVDHISTFSKMKVFERPGDRAIVIMTSGNLSLTQNALNMLELHSRRDDPQGNIWAAESLFDVATLLGQSMREVKARDGTYMEQNNIDYGASFIIGGQIKGERMRLFRLYNEGNFIEASPETPFFQIGEIKYGRPIIDRVVTPGTSLMEAAKCVLVSFDSTMRSNISVGLPIDLAWCERDALHLGLRRRIMEGDPYFDMIHKRWGEGLRRVFSQLPDPNWSDEDATRAQAQYQGEIFK